MLDIDGMVFGLGRLVQWAQDATNRLSQLRDEAAADLERLDLSNDLPSGLDVEDVRMLLLRHRDRLRREQAIAKHMGSKVRDTITLLWSWEQQKLETDDAARVRRAARRLTRQDDEG